MSVEIVGIICFAICIFLLVVLLPTVNHLQSKEDWYDEGWEDCERAHGYYKMTEDDIKVMKEIKSALWAYIKKHKMQKSGDKKRLDAIDDVRDLKAFVWEVCIHRKEQKCQ